MEASRKPEGNNGSTAWKVMELEASGAETAANGKGQLTGRRTGGCNAKLTTDERTT